MNKFLKFILSCLCFLPFVSLSINLEEYHIIHNSNHCSNYFDYFEKIYQIPKDLLRSISIIETGRWNTTMQNYYPWPWAVNQGGKSFYFSSKKEAILKVREFLQEGKTNIDIGCMQINLHHHHEAFFDLNQAFEPKENIEYAAKFLHKNFNQTQNWQQSIANYHSQSPIGWSYATKVLKIWTAYGENRLHSTHCLNEQGKLDSCNKVILNEVNSYAEEREQIPQASKNDHNKAEEVKPIPKKDWTRIKSSMILYSVDKE